MSFREIAEEYKRLVAAGEEPVAAKDEEPLSIIDQGFSHHIVNFKTNTSIFPKDAIKIEDVADSIMRSVEVSGSYEPYFQA